MPSPPVRAAGSIGIGSSERILSTSFAIRSGLRPNTFTRAAVALARSRAVVRPPCQLVRFIWPASRPDNPDDHGSDQPQDRELDRSGQDLDIGEWDDAGSPLSRGRRVGS